MPLSSKLHTSLFTLSTVFLASTFIGCSQTTSSKKSSEIQTEKPYQLGVHSDDPKTAGWELVWSDEFDQASIDPSKWNKEVDCWGGGNDELQCYTDRAENAFTQDGVLHITAIEEQYSGPSLSQSDANYDPTDTSKTSPFTSARLQTKNKMSVRYGRIDVRAKVAPGQGTWSAIWMLPNDNVYGGWPASGEIDIMESLNPGIDDNEVHGTLHYGLPWPQWENKVDAFHMDASPSDSFHVYSTEWEEGEIRWYIDGKHYQTQSADGWYNYIWQGQDIGFEVANPLAPFDQAFFLIMNVAIGGNWPGDPDRNWSQNREMLVDYVRVYQCSESKLTHGKGCATVNPAVSLNTDLGSPAKQLYTLYADGPATLEFELSEGKVTNPLQLVSTGASAHSTAQLNDENGQVIDVKFAQDGAISLLSNATSELEGFEKAIRLFGGTSWSNNGQVEFDILVKQAAADSKLTLSMGTTYEQKGSFQVDLPSSNEWQHVAVKVADLLKYKTIPDGGLDPSNINIPFQLEYQGSGAHFQIDNITLECAYNSEPETWQLDQSCGISARKTPPKAIYSEVNGVNWIVWDCCSGAEFALVDDQDTSQQVIEYTFASAPTAPGIVTPIPLDMSAYKEGALEFEFKQTAPPPEGSVWFVKLEAEVTAGQVLLTDGGQTPSTNWQKYSFPLTGEMNGVDLSNVKRLLIFPDWGKAEGAKMQIKNIKFVPKQ